MNPTQLDQLRDALRRETQQLQPVGLGVETVQRRGRRRRNRGRAFVAVGAATCVAVAGVAVSLHAAKAARHVSCRRLQSGAGAAADPRLPRRRRHRRVLDDALHDRRRRHLRAVDRPRRRRQPEQPGQAIYRTTDGEHWTTPTRAKPWITDLAERDGVLYAIGTAPGAASPTTSATASARRTTAARQWTDTDLPFDASAPSATVSLTRSASVQVARSASTTVALLTEQFFPNLDALVAARTAGHENVTTQPTDAGFDMIDIGACVAAKRGWWQAPAIATAPGCPTRPASGQLRRPTGARHDHLVRHRLEQQPPTSPASRCS